MKSIVSITAITLLSLLPVTFVQAQDTPKAASEKVPQSPGPANEPMFITSISPRPLLAKPFS